MTDVTALEIKGTTLSTVLMVPHVASLDEIERFLTEKFGQKAIFFEGEPAVLDLQFVPDLTDVEGIIDLVRRFGWVPIAVRDVTEEQKAKAQRLHIAVLEADIDLYPPNDTAKKPNPLEDPLSIEQAVTAIHDTLQDSIRYEEETPVLEETTKQIQEPICRRAQVVSKPLRSGQQVYAKDADLIVLAPVSFGAEVIADGNIHVYSVVRGRAVAGMSGDRSARIYALSLQAELVSIAGVYRTFETPLPKALQEKPVQVVLNDSDQIIVELIDSL